MQRHTHQGRTLETSGTRFVDVDIRVRNLTSLNMHHVCNLSVCRPKCIVKRICLEQRKGRAPPGTKGALRYIKLPKAFVKVNILK